MGKFTAHQRYYIDDNGKQVQVPGVTTILGLLAKPALVPWANKLGLDGIEVYRYVDSLADAGTIGHYLIECWAQSKAPDKEYLADYSQNAISAGESVALKFYGWEDANPIDSVIGSEMQLVSNVHRYGGTIDLYAIVDGQRTLLDIKTAKAVYPEHKIQVAAYAMLLEENGYDVDQAGILRLGRSDDEGDSEYIPITESEMEAGKKLFLSLRNVYDLKKLIK